MEVGLFQNRRNSHTLHACLSIRLSYVKCDGMEFLFEGMLVM